MTNTERKATLYIISSSIIILIAVTIFAISMLFSSCNNEVCKIQYTEPDETWNYTYFNLDNVVSYHSSNSKKGKVYWLIYTDLNYDWNNQIISMDGETFEIVRLLIDLRKYDNTNILLDEYEFSILYKIHYQPVLVLVDRE